LRDAVAKGSFHNEPNFICRGDAEKSLSVAPMTLEGEFELGGQEHFYLETQAAHAERGEDGSVFVVSSTQHPSEVQQVISHVLHLPANKVVVQMPPRPPRSPRWRHITPASRCACASIAIRTWPSRGIAIRFSRGSKLVLTKTVCCK
jgi:xanthine dehydrogenase molybdopterin-binding subunit B